VRKTFPNSYHNFELILSFFRSLHKVPMIYGPKPDDDSDSLP